MGVPTVALPTSAGYILLPEPLVGARYTRLARSPSRVYLRRAREFQYRTFDATHDELGEHCR